MYGISYMSRHYIAILRERSQCLLRDAWRSEIATHHVTRHNTPIHNILSTDQFSISQRAQETLPEVGNLMPKHVGDTIRN
jgi:hypothetical protein